MGNPHLVVFVDEDPDRYHLEHIGPALEHHELFPERTNVELARVADGDVQVRVWERGVGETLACGTGACAVAVAANEAGLTPPTVTVSFRGGSLHVERCEDGRVLLAGPVGHVYDAVADPAELQ
jgi:diaminopimelate epimerase